MGEVQRVNEPVKSAKARMFETGEKWMDVTGLGCESEEV
jgi:hypothetical protein